MTAAMVAVAGMDLSSGGCLIEALLRSATIVVAPPCADKKEIKHEPRTCRFGGSVGRHCSGPI